MKTKLDPRSLIVGAFAGATAVLCIAATQTTKTESASTPTDPTDVHVEQVTGIGGVFFKAKDPKAMLAWYRANLGFPSRGSYADFKWREKDQPDQIGHTAWRIFPTNTTYFGPIHLGANDQLPRRQPRSHARTTPQKRHHHRENPGFRLRPLGLDHRP